jgi:hypothetical protein
VELVIEKFIISSDVQIEHDRNSFNGCVRRR